MANQNPPWTTSMAKLATSDNTIVLTHKHRQAPTSIRCMAPRHLCKRMDLGLIYMQGDPEPVPPNTTKLDCLLPNHDQKNIRYLPGGHANDINPITAPYSYPSQPCQNISTQAYASSCQCPISEPPTWQHPPTVLSLFTAASQPINKMRKQDVAQGDSNDTNTQSTPTNHYWQMYLYIQQCSHEPKLR